MVAALATPAAVSIVPRHRSIWPVSPAAPVSTAWVDLAAARDALRAATELTTSLIRAIPNPAYPIPGSSFSLGDAAAHLVIIAQIAADCFAGFPSPIHDLGARRQHEARFLAQFDDRRPTKLAALLEDAVDLLVEAPIDTDPIPFHAGIPLDPGVILGLLVAELMVHGWDIARTLGLAWSTELATARVAASATVRMLPHLLAESAAGVDASFRLHIRGGDDLTCRLHRGVFTVSRADLDSVDCHVSADPVAFILVAHRRLSHVGRVARGQLVSWGHNASLGAKLPSLFVAA